MAPYGNPRVRRRNQRRAWRGASTGRHPVQRIAVTYGQRLRDADWAAAQAGDEAARARYFSTPRGATIFRSTGTTTRNED